MEIKPPPACGIMMRTVCYESETALAGAVCEALRAALAQPAAIMLAGGSTPLAAYRQLSGQTPRIAPEARLFFSDDRLVPPDHAQSNFKHIAPLMAASGVSPDQIIRVRGEWALAQAVDDYNAQLTALLNSGTPLTLGLLGLGADGHTASLFSSEDIRRGHNRFATGVQRPDGLQGVSATPDVFRQVKRLIFVVSGAAKKEIARTLVQQPQSIAAGQAVRGHRGVELWTDRAAWPF